MVGTNLSRAWSIYTKDFGAWLIFGLAFCTVAVIAGSFIPLIGGLAILPLAMRETLSAVEAERAPEIGRMFRFDNIGNDLFTVGLMAAAQTVGLLFCGLGWPVAWLGFFFAPELAAEGRVAPMDAMKLSWGYVTSNLGASLGVAVVGFLLATLGASVMVGIVFTAPLVFLLYACHWLSVRDQIYAHASSQGIAVKPASLTG